MSLAISSLREQPFSDLVKGRSMAFFMKHHAFVVGATDGDVDAVVWRRALQRVIPRRAHQTSISAHRLAYRKRSATQRLVAKEVEATA
jgi:hypothetical protein